MLKRPAIVESSWKLMQTVVLFNEYCGKGLEQDEKSLAFRTGGQVTLSTLQYDVVDAIMATLTIAEQQKHGAKLALNETRRTSSFQNDF